MDNYSETLNSLEPIKLERAYQDNPETFFLWFAKAHEQRPDNVLLQAWHARLNFGKTTEKKQDAEGQNKLLLYTILVSVVAWAIAKIPEYITLDEEWFYPRFIPFLMISGLVAYFNINQGLDKMLLAKSGVALAFCLAVLLLLPHDPGSDSITMALIHMPFLLLSVLGFVYGKGQWQDVGLRLDYIRYGGELLIHTALIIIGGGILTGLTLGLFSLIDIPIEQWFFSFVVLWGAMSAPLITTWLWDKVLNRDSKLAPVIANVFSPLFLIMTVAYLLALMSEQRSPFNDREFLIIFNALLLVVWAITVFSVTGRGEKANRLMDVTNLSLVFVTLLVDAVALAAILYRTFEFGVTPNRVAVTGANLLIFIHLVWIFIEYARTVRSGSSVEIIKQTIARFLPVYTIWSVIVVVLLPVLFGLK